MALHTVDRGALAHARKMLSILRQPNPPIAKDSGAEQPILLCMIQLAEAMKNASIPVTDSDVNLIALGCSYVAQHSKSESTIKQVSPTEEALGIVELLAKPENYSRFSSQTLLNIAGAFRRGCEKLMDCDFSDMAGLDSWKEICTELIKRSYKIQLNPQNYPPKRTLAEVRAMKKLMQGAEQTGDGSDGQITHDHPSRRNFIEHTIIAMERDLVDRPNFAAGLLISGGIKSLSLRCMAAHTRTHRR